MTSYNAQFAPPYGSLSQIGGLSIFEIYRYFAELFASGISKVQV
jgi:hypothetical protein